MLPTPQQKLSLTHTTTAELAASSPDEQRAFWTALFDAWTPGPALQRAYQMDCDDARRDDWVRV